ncbi:tannase and feruloyl esterase [Corynespora cassiicola Philippines]|uniref:Carboxylic ester hydrolase n=1 Tax=Corynespora cassiicola Philippines TaxID=1448308 RepID=A0A2T2PAR3_CORCC|nr:tannase and feruloyl esterase [Corynespora cassiicola Philippines]
MYYSLSFSALGALSYTTLVFSAPTTSFSSKCSNLASNLDINHQHPFKVNRAEYLPANYTIDLPSEGWNETCVGWPAPPLPVPICRVVLNVETSNSSSFIMETWLPENWEGRTLTVGNGGAAGCIQYPDLAYGVSHSFATIGTDAGHNGTSAGAVLNQPEVLVDFVWRSISSGARLGRSLAEEFYACDVKKTYYLGCSSGGRQGWKSVQQDPDLFDGVVAGAPAVNFLGHIQWMANAFSLLGLDANSTLLSPEKWLGVQEEVYRQCDYLDGAADGILEDTRVCEFDYGALLCSSSSRNASTCLSESEIATIEKLFEPMVYNGTELHPGHAPGYEVALISTLYSGLIYPWFVEFFRYLIYSDVNWDPTTFTLSDALYAVQLNPANIQTLDADISAFRNKGGKVLHWHGQADEILSIKTSDDYYDSVRSALNSTTEELDEFYRYFRVSGMGHCFGGPGTDHLGQLGGYAAGNDADDNVLTRIVKWVENGEAPEFIRGTKFVEGNMTLGLDFTRRHCKHPRVNVYRGTGNGTDEEGWECVDP